MRYGIRLKSLSTARFGFVAPLLLATSPAAAEALSRFSADVSSSFGVAANPYLEQRSRESVFAELAVSPRLDLIDELGATALELRFRRTYYFADIGHSLEYGGSIATERRLNDAMSASVSLDYTSKILGERGSELGFESDPLDRVDDDPLPPLPQDPTLTGRRERRDALTAAASFSMRLSERDSFDLDATVSRALFPSLKSTAENYWTYSSSIAFGRTISELTSAGLRASAQLLVSDDPKLSSNVYQAQLFINNRLTPLWSVDGALGVMVVLPKGSSVGISKGLAGSLNACRREPRSILCVRGYRDTSSSGLGGARKRTGASASYSYRIDEYDQIKLSAAFTRVGHAIVAAGFPDAAERRDLLSIDVNYEKRISRRFALGARGGYRDIFSATEAVPTDISGQIYLRTRLGELR